VLELPLYLLSQRGGEMGVDLCGADAAVSEEHLHDADIKAIFEQAGGEGMAEAVGSESGKAGLGAGGVECEAESAVMEMPAGGAGGEDPLRVAMESPGLLHPAMHDIRQREEAFLVALANDAEGMLGGVDVAGAECDGLEDAEAGDPHQFEAGAIDGVTDGREQAEDLFL
jgi:hypothetical protein